MTGAVVGCNESSLDGAGLGVFEQAADGGDGKAVRHREGLL